MRISLASEPAKNVGSDMCGRHFPKKFLEETAGFEGEGTKTVLLCGAFHFENPGDYPLLQCLPKVVHIPGEQGRMVQGFANIVSLITYESASRQAGAVVMLRRLTEMLFIQVIRIWIEQQAETTGGWLAALRDQPISAALGLIHQFPERGVLLSLYSPCG